MDAFFAVCLRAEHPAVWQLGPDPASPQPPLQRGQQNCGSTVTPPPCPPHPGACSGVRAAGKVRAPCVLRAALQPKVFGAGFSSGCSWRCGNFPGRGAWPCPLGLSFMGQSSLHRPVCFGKGPGGCSGSRPAAPGLVPHQVPPGPRISALHLHEPFPFYPGPMRSRPDQPCPVHFPDNPPLTL